MIEKIKNGSAGFSTAVETDRWKLAFVTYSEAYGAPKCLKRHMDTDEAFVLVQGQALLYTCGEKEISVQEMERDHAYRIPRGTWHHLKLSRDAFLIAVENQDTSGEFTERMMIDADS